MKEALLKLKCIVVDDNKMAREAMKHLISQIDFLNLTQECNNSIAAFNYLQKEPVDLVFLDVEMPEMSGIELVRNIEKRPIIILITSKKDYAVEGFELSVADYIVKPVTLSRFIAAVEKAKVLFESKESTVDATNKDIDYIFIRDKSVIKKIKLNDILYIQALGDYVNIVTANKLHTVHIPIGEIEKKLPSSIFYRTHRSYIVGMSHIDNIEEGTAYIHKQAVPVSDQYKQQLLKKINLI